MDLVEYQVSIIGARKLIGKDGLLTKTSDPYCVATVGSCRYQTKVLYRDLEPCWDEKCVLVDLRTNVIYPVRFEVFDLNLGSVDCSLGHCYVTPGSMGWVLLEGAEHGEIQVQVTALPVETLKRIASLEAKIEQLSLENNKSTAQSNATSLCVVDGLQAFYYNIFIQSATGINSADRNGLSDPYCVIELGSHSQKTSIRDATLNPVYEETFEFICCKPEIIKVSLYDFDRYTTDDFLGSAFLKTSTLFNNKITSLISKEMTLQLSCQGKPSGIVHIRIGFCRLI